MNMTSQRRLSRIHQIFLHCFLSIFLLQSTLWAQTRIVGYYPAWLKSTLPADAVQFENLTHINHSFAWPNTSGELQMYDDLLYPQLNQLAHQAQVKMLISLGGWGNSDGFSPSVATAQMRAKFIENIVRFISTNNYDGVDIDWEFPASATDRSNLTAFIQEMHARFAQLNKGWIITFAVGSGDWSGQWYDFTELQKYVDGFNAMCYDYHGSWSDHVGHNAPLFQPANDYDGSIATTMNYLHQTRGVPKSQLIVGFPFYGKLFPGAVLGKSFSGDVRDLRYSEILPYLANGWHYNWDDAAQVPYLTDPQHTQLITFEDIHSIQAKCAWIKEQGYAGGMIWALGQDRISTGQPLLEEMARQLLHPQTGVLDMPEESKLVLLPGNHPNPFNPQTVIPITLAETSDLQVTIYNSAGQKVKTLVQEKMNAGTHNLLWCGENEKSQRVASGIYFYTVQSRDFFASRKMLLIN